MNENVENLLYEAGLTAQGCWDELDKYAHDSIYKLVEITINECVKIMHQQERIPKEYFYAKDANTHEYAIKKHFGMNKV